MAVANATTAVLARRAARIAFGSVLIGGALQLVAGALQRPFEMFGDGLRAGALPPAHAQTTLAITWATAFAAAALAWMLATVRRVSGNPDRLFAGSLVIPSIGIALVLPITLHLLVLRGCHESFPFDDWVAISVRITGAAHLVFAIACALRARKIAAGQPAISPGAIYVLTVATSCVPFILLLAIPPILVAITALPFWPLLQHLERIAKREREALALAPHMLPRAKIAD